MKTNETKQAKQNEREDGNMETQTVTSAEIKRALQIVQVLGMAIMEAKSIPSGELYASVMAKISLNEYQSSISIMLKAGIITENNFVLTWNERKVA